MARRRSSSQDVDPITKPNNGIDIALQLFYPVSPLRSLPAVVLAGLLCLLISGQRVLAAPVPDLYQVVVPVESQSAAALKAASAEGLATLFVRVTGDRATLQHPDIQSVLPQANNYLQQFRYQSAIRNGKEQLTLVLDFAPALVEQRLRFAGQPVWSASRPKVLVWLAVDQGDGRRLLSADQAPALVAAVLAAAKQRGLPVQLPLMDLEDNIALSAEAVWQLDAARAQQAALRYKADGILLGHATRLSNGAWLGSWLLVGQGQPLRFAGEAATLEAFATDAIDRVTTQLASIYAIAPVSIASDGLLLRLQGIAGFTDYARALRYLERLAAVRQVNVLSIEGDQLLLQLLAEGQLEQLRQVLARDGRMIPAAAPAGAPVNLDYRWQGEVRDRD